MTEDTTEAAINHRLLNTTDAAVWTDTFFELHGHRLADIDWGLMVSWFANAIEVGREAGRQQELKQLVGPDAADDRSYEIVFDD